MLTRWFRRGVTAVAVLLAFLMSAPSALAYLGPQTATSPVFVGINGRHELGTMGLSFYGGARFVCIDESGGAVGFMATPTSATAATDVQNWAAAYALAHYVDSPSDKMAAALYYYVGVVQGLNSNPSQVQYAWDMAAAAGKWADSTAELAALTADVNANAGPYDMSQIGITKTGTTGGNVNGVGVQSAAGNWQAGHTVTLTLSGPAVFTATGASTMTVTSAGAPLSEAYTFTGAGTVSVRQSTTGLPENVAVHSAPAAGQQRVVANGTLADAYGVDPVHVVASYTVSATSQVSSQLVGAGQPIHDVIAVTGGKPGASWSGSVSVFTGLVSSPAGGISVPSSSSLPISGVFDSAGNSSVTTSDVTPVGGFVYFRAHIAATADWAAFDAPLGTEKSETALVIAPQLRTAISSQSSQPGDVISDTVDTVDPLPAVDVNGDPITYTVSGILAAAPGAPVCGVYDTANPVFTFGPVAYVPGIQLGTFTVPGSVGGSCLSYGETIYWSSPSGSGSSTFAPGEVTETTPVYAPKITSQVSSQLVAVGGSVHDTLTLTGGKPGASWSGSVAVYELPTDPSAGIAASVTPSTTLPVSGVFDADGKSTVKTSDVVPTSAYVHFWAHLDATDEWSGAYTPKGTDRAETVLVLAPDLKTAVSSQLVTPGATITDRVDAGTLPSADINGAPIVYTVSGVLVPGATCTGPWDTTHPVLSFGPVAYVPGGSYGEYVVPSSSSTSCLTYVETFSWSSPSGSGSVTHQPGLTTETTQIVTPSLHTQISSQASVVGDTITDTVTGDALPATDGGGNPISYTIEGVIVSAPTCAGTFDTTTPVFAFGPVAYVPGAAIGSYTITVASSGQCLSYGEVLRWSSAGGSGSFTYAPGAVTESTSVTAAAVTAAGVTGGQIVTGTPVVSTQPAAGVWAGLAALLAGLVLASVLVVSRRRGSVA